MDLYEEELFSLEPERTRDIPPGGQWLQVYGSDLENSGDPG